MKAIVLGATGAVGSDLMDLLLKDDTFESIDIFVRRNVKWNSSKLHVHVVDFDNPEKWNSQIQGDVVFSCMGTNRKAAGSKANQYKVDYTYQYNFAKAASENGVMAYILVSSMMASVDSKFFYTRMKGELDEAVQKLPFKQVAILRPTSLIRKNTTKTIEKVSVPILKFLNSIGLLRSKKPMKTELVADVMVKLAKSQKSGIFEAKDIWEIGSK